MVTHIELGSAMFCVVSELWHYLYLMTQVVELSLSVKYGLNAQH